jgi:hypothetical protein
MSETPRTDMEEIFRRDTGGHARLTVPSTLSRQLERELAEAKVEIEYLKREIIALRDGI